MIKLLHEFYMGAIEAEIANAPDTDFSRKMGTYYCRWIMALEASFGVEDLV